MLTNQALPIPAFFDPRQVEDWRWKVNYQKRADEAREWAKIHNITAAATDKKRVALMGIDMQLTFGHPDFELFVGGRSGRGAIDDSARLVQFIYRNLQSIHRIHLTLDTHLAAQIFHVDFWVDENGAHPAPATIITYDQVKSGAWKVNPAITYSVVGDARKYPALQEYALHYVKTLTDGGKYPLMIWPYHAILGGAGHCLVPSLEEAAWFHNIARSSQTDFQVKGGNPLTENYSVLSPEVLMGPHGPVASKNTHFIRTLLEYDAVIIAGQAKSHCVAWTIQHLLEEIQAHGPELAKKVYLLEDCTSAVVIPGVLDFTDQADAAFHRFKAAGMNVVKSTDPIESWLAI